MSKVLSDSAVFDAALVTAHGSAELPEGQAAEDFAAKIGADTTTDKDSVVVATDTVTDLGENLEDDGDETEKPATTEADDEANDEGDEGDDSDKHDKVDGETDEKVDADKDKTEKDKKDDDLDDALDLKADRSMKGLLNQLSKVPELKALTDKNPSLKSSLFGMARMADRASTYDSLFHSPKLAETTKIAGDEFFRMDEVYNADDPKEFAKFLIMNSLEYDEKGEPVVDASTGRYKSTGAYERFANYWQDEWRKDIEGYANRLVKNEHDAAKADGEELQEALKVLDRVIWQRRDSAKRQTDDNDPELAGLTPKLRSEVLEARRAKGGEVSSKAKQFETFSTQVGEAQDKVLKEYAEALVNNIVTRNPNIVLSPLSRKHVIAEAIEQVKNAEKHNVAHSASFKHLLRATPQNEDGIKALMGVKKSYYREILPGFLRSALSEHNASTVATAKNRAATIDKTAKRNEPKTTGRGNATPSGQGDSSEALKQAEAKKGKPLTEMEKMDAILAAFHGTK